MIGFTDAEVNKQSGIRGNSEEKVLEPFTDWTEDKTEGGIGDGSLESSDAGKNGWKAEDMFRYNQNQLNVNTGYTGLEGVYT